jgi:putative radical SAM enzyme (TIGR03279 family)
MRTRGLKILEVESGSAADAIGLEPGDRILSANGHDVSDELALRFYLSEELIDLCVRRSSGATEHFEIDTSDSIDLGITVEEFRTQTCNNACLFCFIDQLPKEVRSSLRVKDDDYRLSFLHGNYVTLTNLGEKDLTRIVEQRLSPLFISVHATDPQLRRKILGSKKADPLIAKLRRLVRGGIRIHAQIVLMPGINDGNHLEKTLFDLYRLYPGVQSVAVVPVGLSDHGNPKDRLKPVTPQYSRKLIRSAAGWQNQFRAETGCTFAYLADEFFLQGGVEIPDVPYYDDFAQIEDGIGMVRDFLDEFRRELSRRRRVRTFQPGTLVTGGLFFPILQQCMNQFNHKYGSRFTVRKIENRFLGQKITVAGLLSGKDILLSLKRKKLGKFLIIPSEALSRGDNILLDDLSITDLSERLGVPVYAGGRNMRDFFRLLFKVGRT